jgi:hypothetical protein
MAYRVVRVHAGHYFPSLIFSKTMFKAPLLVLLLRGNAAKHRAALEWAAPQPPPTSCYADEHRAE